MLSKSIAMGLASAGAILALSLTATANDYYVSATAGSDRNSGDRPREAWLTLTHALATVPDPIGGEFHVIHVAPGTYGLALGEQFPLEMRPRVQVVGDQGSRTVILQGSGTEQLVRFSSNSMGDAQSFERDSVLRGVTLQSGGFGILIDAQWASVAPTLEDIEVHDIKGAGVHLLSYGASGLGSFAPLLDSVSIWNATPNLHVGVQGASAPSHVELVDCLFRDSTGNAIELFNSADSGRLYLTAMRTRIVGHGGDSVHVSYANGARIYSTFQACELLQSASSGIHVLCDGATGGLTDLTLDHCTISGHAVGGLHFAQNPRALLSSHVARLNSSILYGNGDDLVESELCPTVVQVTNCDIGDGDYAGINGTFSADPLFLAPEHRDYRLSFGSPCIDRGSPGLLPAGEAMLGGAVPPIDGDLDLVVASDVGARELAPLHLVGEARLGGVVELEAWGPDRGFSRVFFARGLPLDVPRTLRFGELWLSSQPVLLATVPTRSDQPSTIVLPIANDPTLMGRSFTFQAFASTPAGASLPAVLTNAVFVTVP
jgi:hypothetical protein